MAVATERRVPMAANKILPSVLLALVACGCAIAQDATPAPSPPPASSSSSGAHRAIHHIQVPDEDAPTEPPELVQAEAAIEKKNYVAAKSSLHKLVERDSASYVGWFDLGFVENALGNVDASIAAYRKSVAAKPDVFESNLNLGLQLAKTAQPGAEEFLRAATRLKPTSHIEEGQYRAWLALGHALEQSKPEEALTAYERAAALQPKEAEPHFAAGMLLEQENKFSAEAEEYLRKVLAEHPDSAAAEIQLGRVLAAEGKNDEAIAALQAGIKLAPGDEAALRDLVEVYTNAGKNDLAEAVYRTLVAAHPSDAELHRRLGQALLREKKTKEAQQEFLAAVKFKPDLGEAYGDLAFAASENQDYELPIRALNAKAKLIPDNPVTYFLRASASDHLRDFKTAAANYHLFLNTAKGKYPDYEWKAKHRLIAIEPKK